MVTCVYLIGLRQSTSDSARLANEGCHPLNSRSYTPNLIVLRIKINRNSANSTFSPSILFYIPQTENTLKNLFFNIIFDLVMANTTSPPPLCTVFKQILSNNSLMASHFYQHLVTNYFVCEDKPNEVFNPKEKILST